VILSSEDVLVRDSHWSDGGGEPDRFGLSTDPSISPIAYGVRHMYPMITSKPNPRIGSVHCNVVKSAYRPGPAELSIFRLPRV
jgi:hypothetical protein